MSIKKLRKREDKNIISGIGEKGESLFLLSSRLLFLSLSFYLIGNPNPHILAIHLYPPK
jgi:hypothetical protein